MRSVSQILGFDIHLWLTPPLPNLKAKLLVLEIIKLKMVTTFPPPHHKPTDNPPKYHETGHILVIKTKKYANILWDLPLSVTVINLTRTQLKGF